MTAPDDHRTNLVRELSEAGALEEGWREAFEQVPRHLFIPDRIWRLDRQAGGRLLPLHRADDPELWLRLAYANAPVDTQVDDGHPAADGSGYEVTSSASQPSLVAEMLRELALEPGMRVLEIGTGTGWNAALLARRVGAENVVSVEVDSTVAKHARAALGRAGFGGVAVITADGANGWPAAAPYDRVIATVGVQAVPYAWVKQTVAGGRIVAPLTNTFQPPGLVVLTVRPDGTATGRLAGPAAFMGLRSERVPRPRGEDFTTGHVLTSSTGLHPYLWAGDRNAATAIGIKLGDGIHTFFEPSSNKNGGTQWLYEPETRSWAAIDLDSDGRGLHAVRQGGPRLLFDVVVAAYRWWMIAGQPSIEAFTVTVDDVGLTITFSARGRSSP